jgi:DNA-binding CsgD family transcriptional regulator
LTTTEELHATALYREVYAPLRVEYQIAFTLPASPGRILAIAMSRGDRDFSDEERDLLTRARPFLIQAWRNAIQHTALRDDLRRRPFEDGATDGAMSATLRERGLTARQAEVLWLVARGRSNADAPAVLGLSERTVQKHLERSYRALGVSSRSEAATLVWTLAAASPRDETPRRVRLEEAT